MNTIERLRAQIASVEPYPEGVLPVPEPIPGLAFFPGGSGLWQDEDGASQADIPVGGVMVVGHNFDSYSGYVKSLGNDQENRKGATWGPLIALLGRAKVDLHRCFFTNFYMGLIEDGPSEGEFPGSKDTDFVVRCRALLMEQIRIQKPDYILTLGRFVPPLIASMADELSLWNGVQSFLEIDAKNAGFVHRVGFREAEHTCPVVALTHPCKRHLNIGRRRFGGFMGDSAELHMIHDAKSLGG